MAKPKKHPSPDPAAGITRGGSYVVGADGVPVRQAFTAARPDDAAPVAQPAPAPESPLPAAE